MNKFKKVSVDIENELNAPYGGMSDIINQLAEARAKAIDDKIREFGITEENAKDYHIDIKKIESGFVTDRNIVSYKESNKYTIYKKVKIGEFTI